MYSSNAPMRPSQVALEVKNLPANAGDIRDVGLIPGSGRSPGGWHGHPLQYSCLEDPLDRGAWQATVHRVTQIWTQLKRLRTHICMHDVIQSLKFHGHHIITFIKQSLEQMEGKKMNVDVILVYLK